MSGTSLVSCEESEWWPALIPSRERFAVNPCSQHATYLLSHRSVVDGLVQKLIPAIHIAFAGELDRPHRIVDVPHT